jgi:hypothetical protein
MKKRSLIAVLFISFIIVQPLQAVIQSHQTFFSAGAIQKSEIYTNTVVIGETITTQSISNPPYTNSAGFLFTASEPYTFTISGTITYTGNESGFLFVDAYSNTPATGISSDWLEGDTQHEFSMSVPDGNYTMLAFIDVPDSNGDFDGKPGDCEPLGRFDDIISHNFSNCNFSLVLPEGCEIFIKGDVDGNGIVELKDVQLTFLIYMGNAATAKEFNAANVCQNGETESILIEDVRGVFNLHLGGDASCDN